MKYRITEIYEQYFDAEIEADSLEEALEVSDDEDVEWEEDYDTKILVKKTWSLLNDEGEVIDDGEVEL